MIASFCMKFFKMTTDTDSTKLGVNSILANKLFRSEVQINFFKCDSIQWADLRHIFELDICIKTFLSLLLYL
jgi:hypothetical protein